MTKTNNIIEKYNKKQNGKKGLYIHVPFCAQKCYYCDFLCYQNQEKRIDKYFNDLYKEIEIYKNYYPDLEFDSIYWGGGTPSHVDENYIARAMEKIRNFHKISPNAEISIETNPSDIRLEKLTAYKKMGINRISLGVQSFNDKLLNLIARNHSKKQALDAVEMIKDSFDNFSFDLIFAIPWQSLKMWLDDLEIAMKLGPKHISTYSLIVEENTYMNRLINEGKLERVDQEIDREMFKRAKEIFEKNQIDHYEISNFAKKGYQSSHNLKYWTMKDYIGMGLGSSSLLNGYRNKNTSSFKEYSAMLCEDKLPFEERQELDTNTFREDYILMGMRLKSGINLDEYEEIFSESFDKTYPGLIEDFVKRGLLEKKGNNISFTDQGVDLSNQFFLEIIS